MAERKPEAHLLNQVGEPAPAEQEELENKDLENKAASDKAAPVYKDKLQFERRRPLAGRPAGTECGNSCTCS
jgi:hypothetical protein